MPLSESMKEHNLSVVKKAFKQDTSSVMEKECLMILQELGDFVLNWLKGKTYTYMDDTYNLTDSTGCAIYRQGKLTSFKYYPEKQASGPRKIRYKKSQIIVNGRQLLNAALKSRPLQQMGTYTLAVLSMAPYGLWVNESLGDGGTNKRGKGWFDDLKKAVEQEFIRLKAAHSLSAAKK